MSQPDTEDTQTPSGSETGRVQISMRRKILFSLAPFVLLALVLELGFRGCGLGAPTPRPHSDLRDDYVEVERTAPDGHTSVYRHGVYVGQQVFLNGKGFRDWLYDPERFDEAVRIAALGDSFTFGDGLKEDETWPRKLEARLGPTAADGRPIRTENFGRRGSNTAEQIRMLTERILPREPELVVLGFTLFNDAEPAKVRDAHARRHKQTGARWHRQVATWFNDHSYVAHFAADVVRRSGNDASMRKHISDQYAPDAAGWQDCAEALSGIAQACRDADVPLIVVIFPSMHQDIYLNHWTDYTFAEQHDQVAACFAEYPEVEIIDMVDHIQDLQGEVIWVPGNGHPNALLTERVAGALEPLVREKLELSER